MSDDSVSKTAGSLGARVMAMHQRARAGTAEKTRSPDAAGTAEISDAAEETGTAEKTSSRGAAGTTENSPSPQGNGTAEKKGLRRTIGTAEKAEGQAAELALLQMTQLPLFPELSSAMPHHWTRTSLFTSIQRGARKVYQEERLASRSDFKVFYTGPQLDMADNDVFLHVIQLAQNQPPQSIITFARSRFLKSIGRADEGSNTYRWLESSLRRLAGATLFIENAEGKGRMFRLIKDMAWDSGAGQSWLQLDPQIVEFFEKSQIAFIDFEARLKLASPLAKWLQNYASGHRAGEWHHVSAENLRVWSGAGEMRNFLSKGRGLPQALEELEASGVIDESEIYTNIVDGARVKMVRWWRPSGAAKWLREYVQAQPAGWHEVPVDDLFKLSQYRTLKGFLTPGKGLPKMLNELEKSGAFSKSEMYSDVKGDGVVKMCRWLREGGDIKQAAD